MDEKQGMPPSAPPPYPGDAPPGYPPPGMQPQMQQPYPQAQQQQQPAMMQPGQYPAYPPPGQAAPPYYSGQYPPPGDQAAAPYDPAKQAPYQGPPGYPGQQGYPSQPGYPSGYQGYPGYPAQPVSTAMTHNVTVVTGGPAVVVGGVRPPDYAALSWFTCLFCFCPLGLVAVINSNHTRDALARGDLPAAQRHSQLARQYANWAIGVGVSLIVFSIVLRVALQFAF